MATTCKAAILERYLQNIASENPRSRPISSTIRAWNGRGVVARFVSSSCLGGSAWPSCAASS